MRFVVGCDLEGFRRYYRRSGIAENLGAIEEKIITMNPSHLIVWRENSKIVGHGIWHESNTEEHRKGDPRDEEDRQALRKLLGGKKDFVELHEIWLMKEYRGKGQGKKFFDFFEELIKKKGHYSIVYYANHPAAIAICRQRGCLENYLKSIGEYIFYLSLKR